MVHIHKIPSLAQQPLVALGPAKRVATYVPSTVVAERLPGAEGITELDGQASETRRGAGHRTAARIGYLGRLTPDKGVDVLARAIAELERKEQDVELVIAGDYRFSSERDRRTVDRALAEVGTGV